MIKRRSIIILSLIFLLVVTSAVLVFNNRKIIFKSDTYKNCEEIINIVKEIDNAYCKFKLYDVYVEEGILKFEYEYRVKADKITDSEKINAFNSIRTEFNNYLLNAEDFYYQGYPIVLEFDTPHGNDDGSYYRFSFSNYNDHSDKTTKTLDDVRTFSDTKTSDLQSIYGLRSIETIVGSHVEVDSYDVFKNNPDLVYCKIRFEDDSKGKTKVQELLLDCEFEIADTD